MLSTSPHGDAVSIGYGSQADRRQGLAPCWFSTLAIAQPPAEAGGLRVAPNPGFPPKPTGFWPSPALMDPLLFRPRSWASTIRMSLWSPRMNRQELSAIVLELLEKETGETYPALEDSTSLREGLNLDSLDMAGLVLNIESRFGLQVESELLEEVTTVGDLLDVLQQKIAARSAKKAA